MYINIYSIFNKTKTIFLIRKLGVLLTKNCIIINGQIVYNG